jgi:hypothetical protein
MWKDNSVKITQQQDALMVIKDSLKNGLSSIMDRMTNLQKTTDEQQFKMNSAERTIEQIQKLQSQFES